MNMRSIHCYSLYRKEEMWQLTVKSGDATEGVVWREREGSIEMLVKYEQMPGVYCVHNTGGLDNRPVNSILLSSCGVWSRAVLGPLIHDLTPSLSRLRTLRREFCCNSTAGAAPLAMKGSGEALYMLKVLLSYFAVLRQLNTYNITSCD